jgi:4-amino-4-deoxy-L-arabinose transferase-like glycosyltransferase
MKLSELLSLWWQRVLTPRWPLVGPERGVVVGLTVLGLVWLALRFVGLAYSPRGFFSDEFRAALHLVCIGQTGRSGYGDPWPWFIPGAGGGFYAAPFVYLGALWVNVFGPSIESIRAIAAAFTTLAIVGLFGFVRSVAGREAAWWAALVAALSPWSFQFARIAWDPPLAPGFLMLALWAWTMKNALVSGALSGALFSLALYSYPPMRIQAPLVFGALMLWETRARRFRVPRLAGFAVTSIVVAIPLFHQTFAGSLNQRGWTEAVFSPAFVAANRGASSTFAFVIKATLEHMWAHFKPSYLFFTGDWNPRHSTGQIGVFGFVDDLALLVFVAWLIRLFYKGVSEDWSGSLAGERGTHGERWLFCLAGFAFLAGVLPAALCFTGVPHALRSSGAWPFLAMLSGLVLCRWVRRFAPAHAVVLVVALAHSAYFGWAYFVRYRNIPEEWFSVDLQKALVTKHLGSAKAREVTRVYPEGYRYYRILLDKMSCVESQRALETYAAGL